MDNAKQFHEDVMQLAGQIGELYDYISDSNPVQ